MNQEQCEALREWVRAEIELALSELERDECGYLRSTPSERKEAEDAFTRFVNR